MAEAVISAAVEVTLSKAISVVENQINLQWDFKDELNKLHDSLTMTHAFLQDAETRQVHDKPVQVWLKQLKKIACEADDVLDEIAYEDVRRKVETQMRKKVCNFFSISKNSVVSKMSQTVKGINISLNEINDRALKFGLQQRVQTLPPLPRGSRATYSFIDSSQVVGREEDVSKIIDLLIGSSTRQTFSIISIVGMGGLGKTTLAKSVCNNEQIKNYFNKIIWVCVSEYFDVEKILEEIFVSITGKTREGRSRNEILKEIKKELEGKTYLLVLDDVWDEKLSTWEDLRGSLRGINENKQCSILVTTRNENVAMVKETPIDNRYSPRILIEDECWAIIKYRAFQDSSVSSQLEDIGRDIARKCGGVPLVANVIGGTMCNKWDINEWVSLRDSPHWGSLESNEGIISVLKLSYNRLPSPSLKRCFAYCSIFPKDYRIQKEELIQLWMAEDFLQQADQGNSQRSFEDIGDEYFNYLLSNSLLQDAKKDALGCITGCKIHDLVHDLASSISQPKKVSGGVKLQRSLFLESSSFHMEADFKNVRVIKFCNADVSSLPKSIGELKHLRYFDVSNTRIERLPKSVTQLYLLQTMRLTWLYSLKKLPAGMKNLLNMRHLSIYTERHVPDKIGCLTSLRTLPIFDVGTKRGCRIEELGSLNELGGELNILNLQNIPNKEEAQKAKIREKKKLHTLKFNWHGWRKEQMRKDDEEVLEELEPHSNLESLAIESYMGEFSPSWLNGASASFQPINVVELNLSYCKNLKNLPSLGGYPKLKVLKIRGLNNVKCIGNEGCGDSMTLFPALEKFSLVYMSELEEWVDVEPRVAAFPSLKELEIEGCHNLSSIPVMSRLSSLETLSIRRCNGLSLIGDGLLPSSLKELKIKMCKKLRFIPSVEGDISYLQVLYVSGCDELSIIEQGLLASTSLRQVHISGCLNLTSIGGGPFPAGTRLEYLGIFDCHNLISIPSIEGCSFLLSLWLRNCKGLTSLPIGLQTCISLQQLCILECPNLKPVPDESLSLGCLTHLKKLLLGPFSEKLEEFPGLSSIHHLQSSLEDSNIHGWGKLSSLPHQLQELRIRDFGRVKALPEWFGIPNLKTLGLGPFSEELEEFPDLNSIRHHSSLEKLSLYGWEKLSSLPHQLRDLSNLKELTIQNFGRLKSLPEWLGSLSSLQRLEILDCETLEHLPSKEAMQRLSHLQRPSIWNCPRLEKNSVEMSKISLHSINRPRDSEMVFWQKNAPKR